MAVLAVQDTTIAGVTPAAATLAVGGDSFPNNGHVVLEIVNAAGGALTVKADDLGSPNPGSALQFDPDVQISVPAGQRRIWGPFPTFRFNDDNGRVNLTYPGGITSLSIFLYRTRT
ncbi:MAG: hypothetical protein ACRD8U_19575 [Pyrinomonadaceae bacterium]